MPVLEFLGPFKKDDSIKATTKVTHSCFYCGSIREIEYRTYTRCNDLCRTCARVGPPLWAATLKREYQEVLSVSNLDNRGSVFGKTNILFDCKDCGRKASKEYRHFGDGFWFCKSCSSRRAKGTDLLFPGDVDDIIDYDPDTLGIAGQLSEKTSISYHCERCNKTVTTRWAYLRDGGIDGLRVCIDCGIKIAKNKPSYSDKQSRSKKKLWKDPKYRKKMIAAQNKGKATEEFSRKQSAATKERWQDDEYRQMMLEVLAEHRIFRGKISSGHKELKDRLDKSGLTNFESEEWLNQYRVDELDESSSKIIEFYGDYYHANPQIYSGTDSIIDGKSAKEIWEYDKNREEFLKSKGYDLFIVWESDWNSNPDLIISEIENWYYE